MKRIVFYVGFEAEAAHYYGFHDSADKILANTFGGSTRIESRGSWMGPHGLETEPSLRFEVLTNGPDVELRASTIAESLRRLYRQTEVLYSIEPVEIRRAQDPKIIPPADTESLGRSPEVKIR